MGSEAVCSVSYAGQASEGKALLETAEVLFRGDFRLKIPFGEITSVDTGNGTLSLGYNGGIAVFELGRDADKYSFVPRFLGAVLRPLQNGLVQFYALGMVLGLAVFLTVVVLRTVVAVLPPGR